MEKFPAQFIAATHEFCTYDKYVSAPHLRKSFALEKGIKTAEILITGLGFYELHVNGKVVSKLLAPYISAPNDLVYYDKYDLAPYLQEGENVIGLILGNGMQNAFGGSTWEFELAPWRSAPKTALGLTVTYENGESFELQSDASFVTSPSPIYFDDLRCGEYYDARLEQKGWSEPGFDATGWTPALLATSPGGEKRLCTAEPIVVTEELITVAIEKLENGYRYDFGVNDAGLCRLQITGTPGQEIILTHGEHILPDGTMVRNDSFQPPGYTQVDKYICKGGGVETYIPRFTYHGFRYVIVTGITEEQATKELLTYCVMHSDLTERGGFSCSDPIANKLQELTRRSTLANFHYFPTDCPHREKNGWTGDAAVSAEHTLLNLAPEASYREWLRSVRKAQREDGALPGIVPTGGWGFEWGNGPAWDCALTVLPYYTYMYRGDKTILEENGTAIFRYLHYINRNLNEDGLVELGLGDWCPPGRDAGGYKAPVLLTDTITCYDIASKAYDIFDALGWSNELLYTDELIGRLRTAIGEHLIDNDTALALGNCQTSQAMALYHDFFNEWDKRKAQEQLLRMINEMGDHIDTGILGARVIFHVLSDMGQSDLAYKMICRPEYPSYGNWVARGATSLWEDFHETEERTASRNHHFFGDISNWFISRVVGIRYGKLREYLHDGVLPIAPSFIKALDYAEGFHIAPEGKISVKWTRKSDTEVELYVEVPAGLEYRVELDIDWEIESENGCIYSCVHSIDD